MHVVCLFHVGLLLPLTTVLNKLMYRTYCDCSLIPLGKCASQRRAVKKIKIFKGPYTDHILIPRAQPEVVLLCCYLKAYIFLIITQKFQLQIHYTAEVTAENGSTSGIPILIFLCIFVTASFPVLHTCFCFRRENKK